MAPKRRKRAVKIALHMVVTDGIRAKFDALCEREGMTQTELLIAMMAQYEPRGTLEERIAKCEAKLAELADEIRVLSGPILVP